MKTTVFALFIAVMVVAACTPSGSEVTDDTTQSSSDDMQAKKANIDSDSDGDTDITVNDDNGTTEVTLDLNEPENVGDEWCVPGTSYTYSGPEGSVDSTIIGETTYKEGLFCQAESSTVISSPAGDINTKTTYYFSKDYKEYWITTTTSGAALPTPQTNEIHLIDGEVV